MIYDKIIVWADIHIGAANEIYPNPPYVGTDNEFLIGDIIDLANCPSSWIKYRADQLDKYQFGYGDRYIIGNHERQGSDGDLFKIIDTISGKAVLAHGDMQSWGQTKAFDYRSKPHGAGFMKRIFWVNALENFERVFDRKYKSGFILRARNLMQACGANTYCCGHLHPKQRVQINVPEGKIIILSRGRSEVVF